MSDLFPISDIEDNRFIAAVRDDPHTPRQLAEQVEEVLLDNVGRPGRRETYDPSHLAGGALVALFKAFNHAASELGVTGDNAYEFLADLEDQRII
jgi:hypothetical protein